MPIADHGPEPADGVFFSASSQEIVVAVKSNDRIESTADRLFESQRVIVRQTDVPEGVCSRPMDPMTYVIY